MEEGTCSCPGTGNDTNGHPKKGLSEEAENHLSQFQWACLALSAAHLTGLPASSLSAESQTLYPGGGGMCAVVVVWW